MNLDFMNYTAPTPMQAISFLVLFASQHLKEGQNKQGMVDVFDANFITWCTVTAFLTLLLSVVVVTFLVQIPGHLYRIDQVQ